MRLPIVLIGTLTGAVLAHACITEEHCLVHWAELLLAFSWTRASFNSVAKKTDNHAPPPPLRWFQFRLSTWFVLVAIVAWALAIRPYRIAPRPIYFYGFGTPANVAGEPYINPRLLYPALALAAFVGWKAFMAIGRRVRARTNQDVGQA